MATDFDLIAEALNDYAEALTHGKLDGAGHFPPAMIDEQLALLPSDVLSYQKLRAAAEEFIAKVERGEARSRRSYAAFKEALSEAD